MKINLTGAKVDPRPWLKDLPDADLFHSGWLACDSDGDWCIFSENPSMCGGVTWYSDRNPIRLGVSMPALVDDEWESSKISIEDLREWQKNN